MAKSSLDRHKDATTGAFALGRTVAGQLVRTAGPKVAETAGVVRSHLHRHRPASAPAAPEARAPQAPPRTPPPAPAEPQTRTGTGDTVTPADIARNIPKHPPTRPATKKPAARKPAKKAVPGAKLPAKKAAAQPDKP